MRVDPGGSAVLGPVPHNQPIDVQKVNAAVSNIVQHPFDGSILANTLNSGQFNQAEQDEIVREVAQQQPTAFYARDTYRAPGEDPMLGMDEAVIANGVSQAYEDGALSSNDLVHIATTGLVTFNDGQVDSRRFMDILMQGDGATEQGSAAQALAKGLWAKNGDNGSDRAAAALYYYTAYYGPSAVKNGPNTSIPSVEDTFQALVQYSNHLPSTNNYPHGEGPTIGTQLNNQELVAQSTLFTQYGRQIADYFAGTGSADNGEPDVLAQFTSQTVFNPSAQNIHMDDGTRNGTTIGKAVSNTLTQVCGSLISDAKQAQTLPASPAQQLASTQPMEELGNLSGAVYSGAVLALNQYNAQIKATQASKDAWSSTVQGQFDSWFGKIVPLEGKDGNLVGQLIGKLTGTIFDALNSPTPKPDATLATQLDEPMKKVIDKLRDNTPGWKDAQSPDTFATNFDNTVLSIVGPLATAEGGGN